RGTAQSVGARGAARGTPSRLAGALCAPERLARAFGWKDGAGHAGRWWIGVRGDTGAEVLREWVDAPQWRPSEDRWREMKRRSAERDAEVIVAGGDPAHARTVTSPAPGRVPTPPHRAADPPSH